MSIGQLTLFSQKTLSETIAKLSDQADIRPNGASERTLQNFEDRIKWR